MKKVNLVLKLYFLLITLSLFLASCGSSNSESVVGKWKVRYTSVIGPDGNPDEEAGRSFSFSYTGRIYEFKKDGSFTSYLPNDSAKYTGTWNEGQKDSEQKYKDLSKDKYTIVLRWKTENGGNLTYLWTTLIPENKSIIMADELILIVEPEMRDGYLSLALSKEK